MRVRTMVLSAVAVLAIAALPYIPGSPLAAFSAPEILGSGRAEKAPSSAPAANASGVAAPTSPTPTVAVSTPVARPLIHAGPVTISSPGFWSWAVMDARTGQINGSSNLNAVNDTASMIKAWLAADFLRRAAERNQDPGTSRLHEVSIMIRDSDNEAAEDIYQVNGSTASINRLISICGLTDSRATSGSWSKTYLSSRDAVRMGKCIADGRAAGGKWTSWLLTEMRNVRGYGRFGIISALPPDVAKTVAIKNGWLLRTDGLMRINCLAIGTDWVLAVLVRYAGSLGEAYGIGICKSVAAQLLKAP
jgi:hypothetical protein